MHSAASVEVYEVLDLFLQFEKIMGNKCQASGSCQRIYRHLFVSCVARAYLSLLGFYITEHPEVLVSDRDYQGL